jgi:hypothetical protein
MARTLLFWLGLSDLKTNRSGAKSVVAGLEFPVFSGSADNARFPAQEVQTSIYGLELQLTTIAATGSSDRRQR